MKPRILASVTVALLAVLAFAAPARAGLDFTDTATAAGGSGAVRFNGGGIGTSTVLPYGFAAPGANRMFVTAVLGTPAGSPLSANINFSYTGLNDGIVAARYDTVQGDPAYTMIVQMGTITVAPGAELRLAGITFREPGSGFLSIYSIDQLLTSADSDRLLHILIPSAATPMGFVPLSERDLVEAVQLQFTFTGGAGTSFGINAVVNPEPGTIALFGLGLAGLGGTALVRRKRRLAATRA